MGPAWAASSRLSLVLLQATWAMTVSFPAAAFITELYMKIMERYQAGDMKTAMEVQDEATAIIYAM